MDRSKVSKICEYLGPGKRLLNFDENKTIKEAIEKFEKDLIKYLIFLDGQYQCIDEEKMRELLSNEVGRKQIEECLGEYTFENLYTYCAVEVLRDAGHEMEKIIEILCR